MTKKDYRAIGTAIRSVRSDFAEGVEGYEAINYVSRAIADVFEADNPHFDRDRFLRFVKTGKDTRK